MPASMNLIVVGQSGQGTILVSKTLVTALQSAGRTVVCTEYPAITHRFAITYSAIRSGAHVRSPRIRPREADLILGLEPFECLRVSLLYANPSTLVITNDEFIRIDGELNPLLTAPVPTQTAADVAAVLVERGISSVVAIAASEIALRTLKSRAGTNMVLLGAGWASGRIPLDQETLERTIVEVAPRGTGERNCEAFRAGIAAFEAAVARAAVGIPAAR